MQNGIYIGFIASALFNLWKQQDSSYNKEKRRFNWQHLIKDAVKGAILGGGIGFGVGVIVDEIKANEEPINTDGYLNELISTIQIDKESSLYKASEKKCDEVIKFIEQEFEYELANVPFQWGSNVKGTAIEGKSDFDIMVRFNRNSFNMDGMYHTISNVFEEKFQDNSLIKIIDQKKSTGLVFNIQGEKVKIDVVPMRATNDDPSSMASNLYVNNKGLFTKPTFTKTDISLQASIRLTPTQKKVVMMLKKWKGDNNVPISSYLIELFVVKAFEKNYPPKKLTGKLLMVLEFIAENIHTIRLVSPENTNNIVSDISEGDKNIIQRKALKVIEEYEYHPNTIRDFFAS